jgi:hypothetical protein
MHRSHSLAASLCSKRHVAWAWGHFDSVINHLGFAYQPGVLTHIHPNVETRVKGAQSCDTPHSRLRLKLGRLRPRGQNVRSPASGLDPEAQLPRG